MKSYCLKCRKDTENINPRVLGTSNGKAMILSKCDICGSKKSRFIKNQEAKGLLEVRKVPILGDILFWEYQMVAAPLNEIVNKFLLASDKFMPEMHSKQPGFTYSAHGPFTKNRERIQKF